MYKNNHFLGGVAWVVAQLCEFRGNFGGGAASKKGGARKSEQHQGRPQQETPPNLPMTASYRAGSLRGNFGGGVVNTTKMSFSHTAGSAKIFPE